MKTLILIYVSKVYLINDLNAFLQSYRLKVMLLYTLVTENGVYIVCRNHLGLASDVTGAFDQNVNTIQNP